MSDKQTLITKRNFRNKGKCRLIVFYAFVQIPKQKKDIFFTKISDIYLCQTMSSSSCNKYRLHVGNVQSLEAENSL